MLPGAWFFVDPNWARLQRLAVQDLTVGAATAPPILHPGIQNTLHSWALPALTGMPPRRFRSQITPPRCQS